MRLVFILILFLFQMSISAQDYIFFNDSPNSTYYESSSGFAVNPSVVALSNITKIPVETGIVYSGTNSLRLRWKSVAGGDWGAGISNGNSVFDVTNMDSLVFYVFTASVLDSSELPVIYFEDVSNQKSGKKNLSEFMSAIDEDKWNRISIPLNSLISIPGGADLTKIKSVVFGQGFADNSLHTIYLDEIRIISNEDRDTIPPATPTGFQGKAYTTYIYLKWQRNTEKDLAGYRIYRRNGTDDYKIIFSALAAATYFNDNIGIPPKAFNYKISAFDSSGNESPLSTEISVFTTSLSDSVLLDTVQEMTFKYFWDYAHPISGLARERTGSGNVCAIGGSGFGMMAIPVGIERGFITREEGVTRMLKILNFLMKAERFHGAFPHWMDGSTGKVIPFSQKDDGADLVETAYLMQGLLTIKQYFNGAGSDEQNIRILADSLWRGVDWNWFRGPANNNFLFWHWSPNFGWEMNMPILGFNETMITYLLAIASPTHPVPASLYHQGWAGYNYKNTRSFYGITIDVGPDYGGPLFFTHYSFIGFDPGKKRDAYTNYFINNQNIALIHQAYAINNPHNFQGYDADTWGLTASDDPVVGYMAHEPLNDNGTITPSAALSSMPYTPRESINALKSFYYEYGGGLIGEYGFKDAFNVGRNWYANDYIAIDQGPIILMIENYRSGLLWKNFMRNPEIQPMLDAIGFVPDTTASGVDENDNDNVYDFKLLGNYPNPFNPVTTIKFAIPASQKIEINIIDILGKRIKTIEQENLSAGIHEISWDGKDESGRGVSSGIYLFTIKASSRLLSGKMILQK